MSNYFDWDEFRSPHSTPLDPKGTFLQGAVRTPSYNEREAERHEMTEKYFGRDECEKLSFEERYQPGGSTIPRGTTVRK